MPISQINGASIAAGAIPPADLSTGAPAWDGSGNLSFNSGYGSSAVAYGCRAWVNFNGTGTVAIRASGNVSSITDNGTGNYTVNFTNAFSDTSYSVVGFARRDDTNPGFLFSAGTAYSKTTSAMQVGVVFSTNANLYDSAEINCAFFR